MTKLFPSNWPKDELAPQSASPSEVKLDKWGQALPAVNVTNGKSLLEVYADFANDTELVPPAYDPDMMINDRLIAGLTDGRAEKLVNLVSEWSLTDEELADGPLGWEKQLQEVGVLVTLLACATGRKGQSPRIDFFMVYPLTFFSSMTWLTSRCTRLHRRSSYLRSWRPSMLLRDEPSFGHTSWRYCRPRSLEESLPSMWITSCLRH